MLAGAAAAASGAALLDRIAKTQAAEMILPYTPVVTPNGLTLPWTMEDGFKTFRLVAEPVKREFAPGMTVNCWGYNGQTPGPTIEAVEGDRVRIYVTNHLPEPSSVHWHGILLPNGMDGVSGLTQPHIKPGETYLYEFELKQNGTQMYHPHSDETIQMAMGMQGFFIIHPKTREQRIDRDFCIFLQEWFVEPGTFTPNPMIMTDFNLFTFNSRVYPGTAPLVVKRGDRVRVRLANLSMDSHPIHFHGHRAMVVATDAGPIAASAQWPQVTVNVPPGSTRDFEFTADNPGDWPLHCHKNHHAMNAMNHNVANLIGVDQNSLGKDVRKLLPGYMTMGTTGMGEMAEMQMPLPKNTLPMMAGEGPFGPIMMGGMFTLLKVRENLTSYDDPGWYAQPAGTMARRVDASTTMPTTTKVVYTCVMHPEVMSDRPGKCPKCGMKLVEKK
jgi:FtsP/CotA-like multicopper oxidase with cupredoxin domain